MLGSGAWARLGARAGSRRENRGRRAVRPDGGDGRLDGGADDVEDARAQRVVGRAAAGVVVGLARRVVVRPAVAEHVARNWVDRARGGDVAEAEVVAADADADDVGGMAHAPCGSYAPSGTGRLEWSGPPLSRSSLEVCDGSFNWPPRGRRRCWRCHVGRDADRAGCGAGGARLGAGCQREGESFRDPGGAICSGHLAGRHAAGRGQRRRLRC